MDDQLTLYDLLDVRLDASPQEIRDAYRRTKATYDAQNLALYTLLSSEDREETLKKIEAAYLILSDPDKRKHYDQDSHLQTLDSPFSTSNEVRPSHIIPFDRGLSSADDSLLIPPKTNFHHPGHAISQPLTLRPTETTATPIPAPAPIYNPAPTKEIPLSTRARTPKNHGLPTLSTVNPALALEIESQTEWKGELLKRIRETYQISLEEMSATTKVTKTYLNAIESENFSKLPASVYVRGFIVQIAKVLRLPHDQVAMTYLTRLTLSRKV